jgi:hypothetical protein
MAKAEWGSQGCGAEVGPPAKIPHSHRTLCKARPRKEGNWVREQSERGPLLESVMLSHAIDRERLNLTDQRKLLMPLYAEWTQLRESRNVGPPLERPGAWKLGTTRLGS